MIDHKFKHGEDNIIKFKHVVDNIIYILSSESLNYLYLCIVERNGRPEKEVEVLWSHRATWPTVILYSHRKHTLVLTVMGRAKF